MWSLPRIADLKTGKDVIRYGMVEIALQLAIYAHATHWYDPATRQLHDMPPVDRGRAIVMHAPVGQGRCQIIEVDIAAGWEAVQLAVAVRDWRKRKDLAHIITAPAPVAEAEPPATPERVAWIRNRVQAIRVAGYEAELAALWLIDQVPAPLPTHPTDDQINKVSVWCGLVEDRHQMPFGTVDPLFAPFTRPLPQPAPKPEPPVDPDRLMHARQLVEQAWDILDQFDGDQQGALIAVAGIDPKATMTADWVRNLEALAAEVTDPHGGVFLLYQPHGVTVEVTIDAAEARMVAAAGTKGEARDRAARLTKRAGRIAPRSLAQAVENPLLVALVAQGHGAQDTNNSNQSKEQQ